MFSALNRFSCCAVTRSKNHTDITPIANITNSPIYHLSGYYYVKRSSHIEITNCSHSKECYTQYRLSPIFADQITQHRKALDTSTIPPLHHSNPIQQVFGSQFTTNKLASRLWGKNNQPKPIAPVDSITPSPADEWVRMISVPTDLNRVIPNLRLSRRSWYYRIRWNCVLWASLGWRWYLRYPIIHRITMRFAARSKMWQIESLSRLRSSPTRLGTVDLPSVATRTTFHYNRFYPGTNFNCTPGSVSPSLETLTLLIYACKLWLMIIRFPLQRGIGVIIPQKH